MRELFPQVDLSDAAGRLPGETYYLNFDNNATQGRQAVLLTHAQAYLDVAEAVASQAAAAPDALTGCALESAGCVEGFIERMGARIYRRPLDADEKLRLSSYYSTRAASAGASSALRLTLEVMLTAPQFLYRLEVPAPAAEGQAMRPLDGYEMASRLSYLLWGTMPDAALFEAAKAGRLTTLEQVADSAQRMLNDARAHRAAARFHSEWLGINTVLSVTKDASAFPHFTPQIASLFVKETLTFLDHLMFDASASYKDLYAGSYTYASSELLQYYGLPGAAGADFARVDLDPQRSAGILTQGAYLATNATQLDPSLVFRGKFVRARLLCRTLPRVPDNVPRIGERQPNQTNRQKWEAHEAGACAQCHKLMDPIGFALEHFDAAGRYRELDDGLAIDDSGEIADALDATGSVAGPSGLGQRLAASQQAQACFAVQWFRWAYGREETEGDACTLAELQHALDGSGGRVRAMLSKLVTSSAFRYRIEGVP